MALDEAYLKLPTPKLRGGGSNPLTRFELLAAQAALCSFPVAVFKSKKNMNHRRLSSFISGMNNEPPKISARHERSEWRLFLRA